MIKSTKFHGEIEIGQEDIYSFESGIPGFLEVKQFCLLALEKTPFFVLQSIENKDIAFIVSNPFDFLSEYEVKLTDEVLSSLRIETEKDVLTFVILTIREPFNRTTANFQAPIILNSRHKTGKQFIMSGSHYSIQHLIIQPPNEQEER